MQCLRIQWDALWHILIEEFDEFLSVDDSTFF